MRDAVSCGSGADAGRQGKPAGSLFGVHPVELLAHSLRALVDADRDRPAAVDDVIGGCVDQVAEQATNTTRWAWLSRRVPGIRHRPPPSTASGSLAAGRALRRAGRAVRRLRRGDRRRGRVAEPGADVVERADGRRPIRPGDRRPLPGWPYPAGHQRRAGGGPLGLAAIDEDSSRWPATRRRRRPPRPGALPPRSRRSRPRPRMARRRGRAADETIRRGDGPVEAAARPSTTDATPRASPQIAWHGTAGNSQPVIDGSAALLITTSEAAARLGLRPLAWLHSFAVAGDDPLYMLTAIIPATRKVLTRAGLDIGDIDLFEVNEAFVSVVLAWQAESGADLRQGQRQRRGHRHRPPARRERRADHDDAGQRDGPA